MANVMILLFALICLSCGAGSEYQTSNKISRATPVANTGKFLDHKFTTLEGVPIDLSVERQKPIVLIFSSVLCEPCSEEATSLVASLKNKSANPSRVTVITAIVKPQSVADAVEWRTAHRIPWNVAVVNDIDILWQYCDEAPCTIVQTPTDGIVFQKAGAVDMNLLKTYTGDWE